MHGELKEKIYNIKKNLIENEGIFKLKISYKY